MPASPFANALLGALVLLAPAARAQGAITLRVWDRGEFPAPILRSAETLVDHIYGQAGVSLSWRHCAVAERPDDACGGPQGPNDVGIRFVDDRDTSHGVDRGLYGGRAVPLTRWAGSGFAYVYVGRVREVSKDGGIPTPAVLGAIVAHEIGHVLLPGGHSSSGIMRARLGRDQWLLVERGSLWFTSNQSALLKARARWPSASSLDASAGVRLALGASLEVLP